MSFVLGFNRDGQFQQQEVARLLGTADVTVGLASQVRVGAERSRFQPAKETP
jgi:hypothetical protein